MSHLLLAQLVGVVAVTISITVFQVNKRTKMLTLSMFAAFLYTVHFSMLGAYTGSAMNLIGGARCYAFFKVKPDKRYHWVLFAFMGVAILGTIVTWQGIISLLPFFGSISSAFATWHKSPKYIRRWSLLAPPLWFTYNTISGSYPGMLIEIVMVCSNLFGEYRFDFRHARHTRRRLAHPA